MNKQQRTAYRSPCFEAEETINQDFHWGIIGRGGRLISLNLTANIGLE